MSERDSGQRYRRKLTPFLAQEMLYDYATGQLDADRSKAVEEFLEKDAESRAILASIRAALVYTDSLSKSQIDGEILHHLKDAESPVSLGRRYSKWEEWPEPMRWSLTAIAISCMVAASVALVPWSKFSRPAAKPSDTIEVAQISKPAVDSEKSGDEPEDVADNSNDSSGDEGSGDDIADAGDEATSQAAAAPPKPTPVLVAAATPAPAPPPTPAHAPAAPVPWGSAVAKLPDVQVAAPKPTSVPVAQAPVPGEDASENHEAESREAKPKGFVYRAFMNLSDLEELGPKIADEIRALGGEKAGEVELGWKRGTGRYFHFAMPEENQKKLLEKLQVYGPVRISKDPHPRVMPQGKVRIILWVESAG